MTRDIDVGLLKQIKRLILILPSQIRKKKSEGKKLLVKKETQGKKEEKKKIEKPEEEWKKTGKAKRENNEKSKAKHSICVKNRTQQMPLSWKIIRFRKKNEVMC